MEPTSKLKILSFRNCELHCCHLDGYKKQREAFLERLTEIEGFFAEKPSAARFRIWYNVDETLMDNVLIDEIAASVIRIKSHIIKIAFIGLGRMQQWRLTKMLKSETGCQPFLHAYFTDAEKAKEWLV